jgi:hypothetical protein
MTWILLLVTMVSNEKFEVTEVSEYNFKPRCEIALKAKSFYLESDTSAYVCIKRNE